MAFLVKEDKASDPINVSFFRAEAEAFELGNRSNLV